MSNLVEKQRIICFGDSNTWGYDTSTQGRFPAHQRWACLLEELLGNRYEIVEEGLSGRTAVMDDPLFEGLNSLPYIHPCLMSHSPIKLVIIMLGTNDTKERFHLNAYNIAQGIVRLALKARETKAGNNHSSPGILVVAPPPIREEYSKVESNAAMGGGCHQKSEQLSIHLEQLLSEHQVDFLDAKESIKMNNIDYMHLDQEGHQKLSELIFNKVSSIL